MIEEHYCTLQQARDEMGADNATDLDYTFRTVPQMSREISNFKRAMFEPVRRTVTIYPSPATVSPNYRSLQMIDPATSWRLHALELLSVTNGTRALDWGTDVTFYHGQSDRLYMVKTCDLWTWAAGCAQSAAEYSVTLDGWFGFRRNYPAEGWHEIDALNDDIDASATGIDLLGALADAGYDGRHPKLSPGHLIKVVTVDGENEAVELMRVMIVPPLPNEHGIDVRRGENGTVAIPHTAQDKVYVWSVQPEIVQAAQRWIDLRYDRRGTFDTRVISDGVSIDHPGDMPVDVRKILGRLVI